MLPLQPCAVALAVFRMKCSMLWAQYTLRVDLVQRIVGFGNVQCGRRRLALLSYRELACPLNREIPRRVAAQASIRWSTMADNKERGGLRGSQSGIPMCLH
jgi:hypothetical protein